MSTDCPKKIGELYIISKMYLIFSLLTMIKDKSVNILFITALIQFQFQFQAFIVIASKCNEISKTTHRGATIT